MTNLTVDVSQLKTFARDLRRADPILAKNFLTGMARSGDIVALAAKRNAAFSTRIPASIKVRRRGLAVRVQAGGDKAPDAAPFEHGGLAGTFRHPVFGNRNVWVTQRAHPFLTPAVEQTAVPFEAEILAQVDKTFVEAGWHA